MARGYCKSLSILFLGYKERTWKHYIPSISHGVAQYGEEIVFLPLGTGGILIPLFIQMLLNNIH